MKLLLTTALCAFSLTALAQVKTNIFLRTLGTVQIDDLGSYVTVTNCAWNRSKLWLEYHYHDLQGRLAGGLNQEWTPKSGWFIFIEPSAAGAGCITNSVWIYDGGAGEYDVRFVGDLVPHDTQAYLDFLFAPHYAPTPFLDALPRRAKSTKAFDRSSGVWKMPSGKI